MSGKLIYVVRHGETDLNKLGIVQGCGIDAPLNERGIAQAGRFYEYYRNIRFDKIYTSALIRSQQTMQPFIEAGFKYEIFPELNEISWGVFDGKVQSKEESEIFFGILAEWEKGNYHARMENGESALELQTRQLRFISKLKERKEESCVLICMHGRAMKSLICTLLGRPLSEMEEFQHSNLCLYILEQEGDSFNLILRNDIRHLSVE